MSVRHIDDLVAFQFACEFRDAVGALLAASPRATGDFRFAEQLRSATDGVASNISEGFHRFLPSEGAQFLRYALSSLAEAKVHLESGISWGYYSRESCASARLWAGRCHPVALAFLKSLLRNAERDRQAKRLRNRPTPPPPAPAPRPPLPPPPSRNGPDVHRRDWNGGHSNSSIGSKPGGEPSPGGTMEPRGEDDLI